MKSAKILKIKRVCWLDSPKAPATAPAVQSQMIGIVRARDANLRRGLTSRRAGADLNV